LNVKILEEKIIIFIKLRLKRIKMDLLIINHPFDINVVDIFLGKDANEVGHNTNNTTKPLSSQRAP